MLWARYLEALKKNPIRTNTVTALVINFAGDVLAQRIEHYSNNESIPLLNNWERTGTVASYGMVTAGPAVLWFRWLDKTFPITANPFSAKAMGQLARKLTVHLGIFAPTINACFYGWLIAKDRFMKQQQPILSVENTATLSTFQPPQDTDTMLYSRYTPPITTFWQEWYSKLAQDLLETQKNSVKLWGTAQTFNFLFLPPHTRVLFNNCVSVVWTAYMSVMGHRDNTNQTEDEEQTTEAARTAGWD